MSLTRNQNNKVPCGADGYGFTVPEYKTAFNIYNTLWMSKSFEDNTNSWSGFDLSLKIWTCLFLWKITFPSSFYKNKP